jgi:hypothetical protein
MAANILVYVFFNYFAGQRIPTSSGGGFAAATSDGSGLFSLPN